VSSFLDDAPLPRWQRIGIDFIVYTVGIPVGLSVIVGAPDLYDLLAPEIAARWAAVGQWVAAAGQCVICCGHGT
jgi:hypothetical protein